MQPDDMVYLFAAILGMLFWLPFVAWPVDPAFTGRLRVKSEIDDIERSMMVLLKRKEAN